MFGKDPYDKSGFKGGMMHKGPGGPAFGGAPAGYKGGAPGQNSYEGKWQNAGGNQGFKGPAGPNGNMANSQMAKAGPQGGADPNGKGHKEFGTQDYSGKSMQGKAPGQYLSGVAQSRLMNMGMTPGGVRQLAAGQMPTAPSDQSVLLAFLSSSLG